MYTKKLKSRVKYIVSEWGVQNRSFANLGPELQPVSGARLASLPTGTSVAHEERGGASARSA